MVHISIKRDDLVFGLLLITALTLAAPVSAAPCAGTVTLASGGSIAGAVSDVCDYGTIVLGQGTYPEYGITIEKNLTIRAADGYGPEDIVINGMQGGSSILTIGSDTTVVLDNLTFYNGTAIHGGAVYNNGQLYVNSSVFRQCWVRGMINPSGGAIFNNYEAGETKTLAVTASTFEECNATSFGGAIMNEDTITAITSSTFTGCSAYEGGAVHNSWDGQGKILSIASSSFTGCSVSGEGGAISNRNEIGTITSSSFTGCSATNIGGVIYNHFTGTIDSIRFSRFYGNTAPGGQAIDNSGSLGTAADNWWGSNSIPSGTFAGNMFTYSPWLVLNASAVPSSISIAQTSTIRMNLTNASDGTTIADTASGGIFVPDDIPVTYSLGGVTGSLSATEGRVTAGTNTTVMDPSSEGTATITVTVDGQQVTVPVTVHAVCSDPVTLSSGGSIAGAVAEVCDGGTIVLGPGTYRAYGITIAKSLTIRPADGYTAADTIIDGMKGGSPIFTINSGHIVTLDSLTLQNGTATNAGAIINDGTTSITSVTFRNCSASNVGGAIVNRNGGTMSIADSTFTGCTVYMEFAGGNGGAIDNEGTITSITSTTFRNCSASGTGGAIFNLWGTINSISSSTFDNCTARDSGGAITNTLLSSITTIRFSRFYHNTAPVGPAIVNDGGCTIGTAANNWWGSNSDPYGSFGGEGSFTYSPWLVLNASAEPSSITTAQTSTILMKLTNNSAGDNTLAGGHVPDMIPVAYSLSGVTGSLAPGAGNVVTGTNSTVFGPSSGGTATIWVAVDDESVPVTIAVVQAPATHFRVTAPSAATAGTAFPFTVTALDAAGHTATWYTGSVNFTSTDTAATLPANTTLTNGVGSFSATLRTVGTWFITATDTEDISIAGTSGSIAVSTVPITTPTATTTSSSSGSSSLSSSSGSDDDYWGTSSDLPLVTVTVNIGGDSKAWQAVVTGTKLAELIVTGNVQSGAGGNMTAPPGTVFQYISLVPARYNTITKAVIHFSIPQSWLDENHIDKKSIVLYHQTANGWEALPTTVVSTKDGTVYFSAESTGFSLFAIAGTPTIAKPPVAVATTQGIMSEIVQTPAPAASVKAPVTTQTTAPPAASPQPAAPSPLLNIILVIAAIGVLAGGGFMARRWWIRRQNPELFEEYD